MSEPPVGISVAGVVAVPEVPVVVREAETEDADPSYVWVTMRRLRQKVEVDANRPMHVQTVRGVGYRLVGAAGSPATLANQSSEAGD